MSYSFVDFEALENFSDFELLLEHENNKLDAKEIIPCGSTVKVGTLCVPSCSLR